MTAPAAPITEVDLHAYLDGELGPARRQVVAGYLAAHPAEAGRLDSYRRHDLLIRRGYRPLAERVAPSAAIQLLLPARAIAPRRRRRLAAALAASVLLLGLGGALGWFGRDLSDAFGSGRRAFVADAFDAHLVYAAEVRHPVEVRADEQAHLQTWLARRLDVPLVIPDLGEAGYELIGGRLLPAEGGAPAAQLMYESGDGQRVTLYLRQAPESPRTAFRFSQVGELSAFYWMEGGVGWAILGTASRGDLLRLAHVVYAELDPA